MAILKRSLAHFAEAGMDAGISTRKVAMSGTHLFGNLMLALLDGSRASAFRALKQLLMFWQKNGKRE
ncbi:hypothetical protein, partial [Sansalvadorimonas verongulae]|uniref:hypothetical protein n=1 Tax=Sansalvadorimonas verongulae TaxID=2172824 RepID=UPI0012BD1337